MLTLAITQLNLTLTVEPHDRNAPPFSFFRQRPRGGAKAALLPQSPEALENRGDVGRLPSDVYAKRVQSLHLREFRRDQGPYQADRGRARGETNFLILIAVKDIISTRMASDRSEEHTSELQSLMRTSYAVFCLTKKNK